MIKKLLITTAFLLSFVGMSLAQTSGPLGFAWDIPDSGGVVVKYVVEVYKNDVLFSTAETDTNYYEFTVDTLIPYQIRVAGVDISDNQGIFSEKSDIEILDFGPPSQPGKPYRVE